jgi:type I restriction enzyme S subunit
MEMTPNKESTRIETVMAGRYKPYPAYKDSGVEWLGKMPAHWIEKRLKFTSHIEAGQSPPSELVTDGMEGLPFLQGNADFGLMNPTPQQVCDAAPKRACLGDILLSVRAPVGALNIAEQEYGIGRGLCAIRKKELLDNKFLLYLLIRTRAYLDSVATGSTYDAVTVNEVGDIPTLLPPISEQRAIVAFLDRETARIDELVVMNDRLIKLLQKKRTVLITRSVTKGLDPNVPMKDSGVEWLGEIPSHWDVVRLKVIATVQLSNVDKKSLQGEEPVQLCNYTDVYYHEHITSDLDFMQATATPDQIRRFSMRKNDVLITKDSESWTDIAISSVVTEDNQGLVCGYHLALIRPNTKCHGPYLSRAFTAIGPNDQFQIAANGITRFGLGGDAIRTGLFMVPPISEQRAIAAFLDRETAQIDALITKVRDAIKRLKEYRTTLISAAVTGKIDVRGEAE